MKKERATKQKQNYQGLGARVLAAGLSAVILAASGIGSSVQAAETKDEMTYYEWTWVHDIGKVYVDSGKGTIIRTMLCYNHDGYRYISGEPSDWGSKNNWNTGITMDSDRQVFPDEGQWLTDNGRGAPYFVCAQQRDKDNSQEPMVKIMPGRTTTTTNKLGQPSFQEYCDGHSIKFDDDDLAWTNSGKGIDDYNCTIKGKSWHHDARVLNIFHNERGRDPVLKTYPGHLSADYETDEDDRWKFWLYQGKEKKFARYPDGIAVQGGQVTAMTVPSVLPEGTLTTVNPGSVLSVNSTVFLGGKIVVDGGTLVLQEGAKLMTYSRFDAKAGTGCIEVKNGGSIVVMNNAKLALGKTNSTSTSQSEVGQVKLTDGGKIYNFGFIMVNRFIMNDHASVENRKGGEMHLGYQLTDIGAARYYFNKSYADCLCTTNGNGGSLISASESKVQSMKGEDVLVVNKGKITLSSIYNVTAEFTSVVEGNAPTTTTAIADAEAQKNNTNPYAFKNSMRKENSF